MHISEGVLSPSILVAGYAIAAPAVVYSFKSLNIEKIIKTASFSAVFLLASFIHVPIGVSSIHLLLIGILGVMLGIEAILAIFVALFLSALMFGFGGIYVLGVNTTIMSSGAIAAYLVYRIIKNKKIAYFLAGFLGILISSLMLFFVLFIDGQGKAGLTVLLANIPLMFVEGVISFLVLSFLQKIKILNV